MKTAIALFAFLASSQAGAADLPARLHCHVISSAGCAKDGICVGAGRRDPTVRLTVNTRTGTLDLNGIEGQAFGEGPIVPTEARQIWWRLSLIGLNKLSLHGEEGRGIILRLSEYADDRDTSVVGFACRG